MDKFALNSGLLTLSVLFVLASVWYSVAMSLEVRVLFSVADTLVLVFGVIAFHRRFGSSSHRPRRPKTRVAST